MANLNAPRGFTPVKYRTGQPYTGICRMYYKSAAVAIGVGDPVIRVTNSADPAGNPECTRHTAGAAITGVVVGVVPSPTRTTPHLASADTGYLLVADDPQLLFEVQANSTLLVTNIGEHINTVTALNCDTTTGRSKFQLDAAALGAGGTFRIEGLVQKPSNDVSSAYSLWLVAPNLHTDINASATNLTAI